MLGKRLAWRLLRCSAWRLRNLDGGRTFVSLELFQSQLELLNLAVQLLGTATELHAAQLRNQQFQVLDLSVGRSVCRLVRFDHILQMSDACIALKQQGLECFDVVRIGVCRGHAGSLRGDR